MVHRDLLDDGQPQAAATLVGTKTVARSFCDIIAPASDDLQIDGSYASHHGFFKHDVETNCSLLRRRRDEYRLLTLGAPVQDCT